MLTNELKKGAHVLLRNGLYATVYDNAKGNTRMCKVEGMYTEIGLVYAHDIIKHFSKDGETVVIEHTEKQMKLRDQVMMMGF